MKATKLRGLLILLILSLLLTACASISGPGSTTTVPDETTQPPEETTAPEQTTAPTEAPIQAFPDAPEELPVKALPESYDAAVLAPSYWKQAMRFGSHEYYVDIPAIYPMSEAAVACQQEIYEAYEKRVREELELLAQKYIEEAETFDLPENPFYDRSLSNCFSYEAGCRDGVLSVAVRFDVLETPRSCYTCYYLDLTTGERLEAAEAWEKYGVDAAEVRAALEAYFREMHAGTDMSLSHNQENLQKTVSDENVAACRVFSTKDGYLMMVAQIYTAGSVDKVERLIDLG